MYYFILWQKLCAAGSYLYIFHFFLQIPATSPNCIPIAACIPFAQQWDTLNFPHHVFFEIYETDVVSTGSRVRNLKAFQVLESVFQKSSNPELCHCVLLAIKSIWCWDSMNFFLLEWSLQPISQFVGTMPLRSPLIQTHFFKLVESLVMDLCYIPHEILKKVQILIKENSEPLCTSFALSCLHSIAQKDLLFTDIFRDSGLLGMLLAQLRKEAKILRKKGIVVYNEMSVNHTQASCSPACSHLKM